MFIAGDGLRLTPGAGGTDGATQGICLVRAETAVFPLDRSFLEHQQVEIDLPKCRPLRFGVAAALVTWCRRALNRLRLSRSGPSLLGDLNCFAFGEAHQDRPGMAG
jgi:hypothetical protein